jgi:hypothetical protein
MYFDFLFQAPPLNDPVAHRAEGVKQRKLHINSLLLLHRFPVGVRESLF